jgi:hypothetical protein
MNKKYENIKICKIDLYLTIYIERVRFIIHYFLYVKIVKTSYLNNFIK